MKSRKKQGERGFITVALLALFPMLLSALAVASASYLAMRAQIEETHICRLELLSSQEKVRANLVRLMQLNKEASLLRAEKEAAEAALATAVFPPQFIAAQAALNAVETAQLILAAKQQALILAARTESRLGPERARQAVQSALRKTQSAQSDGSSMTGSDFHVTHASFEITASPKGSETPDYNPASTFTDSQNMSVSTEVKIDSVLPNFLSKMLIDTELDLNLKIDCSATLRKGDDQWHTTLNADKSSSNSSSWL